MTETFASGMSDLQTHTHRSKIIAKIFKIVPDYVFLFPLIKKDQTLIDFGCGNGEFFDLIKEVNAIGIDIDRTAIAACKKKGYKVYKSFKEVKTKADIITATQVVEHLTPTQLCEFCKDANKSLKANGLLCISTINPNELYAQSEFWKTPDHIRPYPERAIKSVGKQYGFKYCKTIKHHYRTNPLKWFINLLGGFDRHSGYTIILRKCTSNN